MTGSDEHSPQQGRGPTLPGQPTEEAIAEVGSAAGKSLVRGFQKLGSALVSEWVAKREAKAEAARIAARTEMEVSRERSLVAARRVHELEEIDHQAALQRRAERLRYELAREQLNLEAIERRAVEFAEDDPTNENARELDDDWLFRFADLAQKVSDKDIQGLWARALASASLLTSPRLSAAALQLLSLVDAKIAADFRKFIAAERAMGIVPVYWSTDGQVEPQGIDIFGLRELGLIANIYSETPYRIFGTYFGGALDGKDNSVAGLATGQRGDEIAGAVFRGEKLSMTSETEAAYAKMILGRKSRLGMSIVPIGHDVREFVAVLPDAKGLAQNDWRKSQLVQLLQPSMVDLLEWASQIYQVEVRSRGELVG